MMVQFTHSQRECIEFGEATTKQDQSFASEHSSRSHSQARHLVIEAGAGAGKTAVLAHRVHRKIVACPEAFRYAPHEIVMATFTRAAEKELKNRVRGLLEQENLGHVSSHIQISTIDSLLMALFDSIYPSFWEDAFLFEQTLRSHTAASTTARVAQLVDDAQIASEMNSKLLAFFTALELEQLEGSVVLDFLLAGALKSALQPNLLAPRANGFARRGAREDLIAFLCSEACLLLGTNTPEIIQRSVHPGLFLLFGKLCSFAKKSFVQRLYQGRISHNDRLIFLYNVFCVSEAQKAGSVFAHADPKLPLRFKELIVDEYQDTNPAQHQLLSKLVSLAHARMVVVGDPKQSLYGFRRAKVEVFHELKKSPDWHHITLSENFRSNPELLYELNHMSYYALTYQNHEIDASFWQTAHGQAALLSQVPPAVLHPGRLAKSSSQHPRVQILTHSLNKNRIDETAAEFSYEKYSGELICTSLANFLMLGFKPEQIVVLCETNGDCQKVHELLQKYSPVLTIPSKLSSKKASDASHRGGLNHAHRSAITLLAALRGQHGKVPQEVTTLMLFDLFASPLFGLDLESAWLATFGLIAQDEETKRLAKLPKLPKLPKLGKLPQIALLFQRILTNLQDLAQSNAFAAWQILRSELTQHSTAINKQDFHESMTLWGLAFSDAFQNKSWRNQIQTKEGQEGYSETLHLLSESLLRLGSTSLAHATPQPQATCVEIMTVHAAKGLQWPVVFFVPKQKETPSTAQFRCLSLSDRNVVQWLDSEKNPLEIYARIENAQGHSPNLESIKLNSPTQSEAIPERKVSELKMQEAAEKMFERSRIFYTAITRAEEHLILFTGMGTANMKNSLRDKIAELTEADGQDEFAKKVSGFINWTLGTYLDEVFDLRAKTERIEGQKRTKKKVPEPWLICEAAALKESFQASECVRRSVSYFDFAGPSLAERTKRCKILQNPDSVFAHRSPRDETTASQTVLQHQSFFHEVMQQNQVEYELASEEKPWQEVWELSLPTARASALVSHQQLHEGSEQESEDETFERSRISNIQQGILFHAERELDRGVTSKNDLATLEAESWLVLREFEIWTLPDPAEEYGHGAHLVPLPTRNVVDLICFCSLKKFKALQSPVEKETFIHCSAPQQDTVGRAGPFANAVLFDPYETKDFTLTGTPISSLGFGSEILDTEARSDVCIVVDYKTGQPQASHGVQMQRYLAAVSKLLRAELLLSSVDSCLSSSTLPCGQVFIAGYLAYIKPGTEQLRLVPVQ